MKKKTFLFILIFCLTKVYGQNYIDKQQNRIDLLDGVQDGRVFDSIFSFVYFVKIDEIQEKLKKLSISDERRESFELCIFMDLYPIDQNYLSKYYFQPQKYLFLENYLTHIESNSPASFFKSQINKTFEIIEFLYKGEDVEDFLASQALNNSELFLKNYAKFSSAPFAPRVLSIAALNDPILTKKYFNHQHPIYHDLSISTDDNVKMLMNVFAKTGGSSKALVFLESIKNNEISTLEADGLSSKQDNLYFSKLIDLSALPAPLAKKSIDTELYHLSIKKIRPINAEYEAHDSKERFKSLEIYRPELLYTLMVYSEEEIFTSSFTGIFELYMKKLNEENRNTNEIIKNLGYNKFRTFIKMCASYGKLEILLARLSKEESQDLLSAFANLESSQDLLREAVCIADALGSIKNTEHLAYIEDQLYLQLQKTSSEDLQIIYNLLIQLIPKEGIAMLEPLALNNAGFEIQSLNSLDSTSLFGSDNIHTQVLFFYDDEDGISSYNSFIQQFKKDNWRFENFTDFVKYSTIKGKAVQILANKPNFDQVGPKHIFEYLEVKHNDVEVLVHRGHSFYVSSSLNYMRPDIKLVFLGSCGGYNKVVEILNQAPKAQIIATKQIGSRLVNDPLLFAIATEINSGSNLYWDTLWDKFEKSLANNAYAKNKFSEYVPPHKNLGAGFIQAYNRYFSIN